MLVKLPHIETFKEGLNKFVFVGVKVTDTLLEESTTTVLLVLIDILMLLFTWLLLITVEFCDRDIVRLFCTICRNDWLFSTKL